MRGINYGSRTPTWHVRRSRVVGKSLARRVLPYWPLILLALLAVFAVSRIAINEHQRNIAHKAKMAEFDRDMKRASLEQAEWWRKFNDGFLKPEDARERASRVRVLPVRIVR